MNDITIGGGPSTRDEIVLVDEVGHQDTILKGDDEVSNDLGDMIVTQGHTEEVVNSQIEAPSFGSPGKQINKEEDICSGGSTRKGQTGNVGKGLTNVESPDENDVPECEFYRGKCNQHKVKGNKTIVKVRKWVKKKNGEYSFFGGFVPKDKYIIE